MSNVNDIMAQMTALMDGAEGRNMDSVEIEKYESLEGELRTANKEMELRARQLAYNTPVTSVKNTSGNEDTAMRAFANYLRSGNGAEYRAQSEGSNSEGGFTVPQGFRQKLVDKLKAFGGLAAVVDQLVTSTGQNIEYPTLDYTAVNGAIAAEGAAAASGTDLVFGSVQLGAYKYTAAGAGGTPLRISAELLQDSAFDILDLASKKLGMAMGRKLATDIAVGTGVGEPKGILRGTADVSLATSNSFTNAANGYAKLLAVIAALDPAYEDQAKWIMNKATWLDICAIVDTTGRPLALGQDNSAFSPAARSLFGYPVILDQSFPSAADATPFMAFGDLEQAYVLRTVTDVRVMVNPYTRMSTAEIEVSAWMRADGTIQNRAAYIIVGGK